MVCLLIVNRVSSFGWIPPLNLLWSGKISIRFYFVWVLLVWFLIPASTLRHLIESSEGQGVCGPQGVWGFLLVLIFVGRGSYPSIDNNRFIDGIATKSILGDRNWECWECWYRLVTQYTCQQIHLLLTNACYPQVYWVLVLACPHHRFGNPITR